VSEVLACVDFSDATDAVAREGARLATTAEQRLHLIHVAAAEAELAGYDKGPVAVHTRDDRADGLRDEHHALRELAARLEADVPGLHVVPIMAMGPTVAKILDEAERLDAGTIVVGSHGHGGLHHLLLGSVSEGLIRHSPRPVVVVPVAQR
jgi:nucleotide-binding universal stress UspA family protein